jgi:hypothetical protein
MGVTKIHALFRLQQGFEYEVSNVSGLSQHSFYLWIPEAGHH